MFLNSAPKSVCYQCTVWFYMKTLWLEPAGLVLVSVVDIHSHFCILPFLWLNMQLLDIHAFGYAVWIIFFNFNMLFNIILQCNAGLNDKSALVGIYLGWPSFPTRTVLGGLGIQYLERKKPAETVQVQVLYPPASRLPPPALL